MIRKTEKTRIRAGTPMARRRMVRRPTVRSPGGSESPRRRSIPWMASPTSRTTAANTSLLIPPSPQAVAGGSLPFDRARRLGGDVVDDAVHALDLVDNPGRDPAQYLVGQ